MGNGYLRLLLVIGATFVTRRAPTIDSRTGTNIAATAVVGDDDQKELKLGHLEVLSGLTSSLVLLGPNVRTSSRPAVPSTASKGRTHDSTASVLHHPAVAILKFVF